jgi:predicted DNA-binding protein (UPF0251 family)
VSPRPTRLRRVSNPPPVSGFRPYGGKAAKGQAEKIFLHYEEYEVLRLCDYEMLNHHQACSLMDVSRPTFTRIYGRARSKIAEALVTGKQIIIEGGKVYFDSEWYACSSCGCYFNQPDKQDEPLTCPLCGGSDITGCGDYPAGENGSSRCEEEKCICMKCGYETEHIHGKPCREEVCPECGSMLVRAAGRKKDK